jgi:hypothetical protein
MGILHSDHPQDCGRWSLWVGLLGAPAAWLLQVQVNYALVPWSCQSGNLIPLHVASAVFLACGAGAGLAALRNWQKSRNEQMAGEPAAQCRLFMGKLGLMVAPLFCAIIIWNWIAVTIFSPCL